MSYQAGIDIGSVAVKCVVVDAERIVACGLLPSGTESAHVAAKLLEQTLASSGIGRDQLEQLVATGYGRRSFGGGNRVITEISAAAYGAFLSNGRKACTLLDVGGQDTKLIEVDSQGRVKDFLMNDKCAAGTGRFLEIMAHVLGVSLEEFSELAVKSGNKTLINATCSVFAESEVVSLFASGCKKEDIAAGLIDSIALRIGAMARGFGIKLEIYFCGGGARINALRVALSRQLACPVTVFNNAQFIAALGAACTNKE